MFNLFGRLLIASKQWTLRLFLSATDRHNALHRRGPLNVKACKLIRLWKSMCAFDVPCVSARVHNRIQFSLHIDISHQL